MTPKQHPLFVHWVPKSPTLIRCPKKFKLIMFFDYWVTLAVLLDGEL